MKLPRIRLLLTWLGNLFKSKHRVTPPTDAISPTREIASFVRELTGQAPKCEALFLQAFTHKSFPGVSSTFNNERLEYLGDSVLSLSVSHLLYNLYPDDSEGNLSQLRSYLTSRSNLNSEALRMGIDKVIRVAIHTDLDNSDILGNALEAFLGALYIERGMEKTSAFIHKQMIISRKNMEQVSRQEEDYKTEFIILMQRHKIAYRFEYLGNAVTEKGFLSHKFQLRVGPHDLIVAEGEAGNKKAAHQLVAAIALQKVKENVNILDIWGTEAANTNP